MSVKLSQPVAVNLQERFEFIDALRGIAAFSVLLLHLAGIHNKIVTVPRWAGPFVLNGGMGVTLFFVVSAFCLCLTMRKHEAEPGRTSKFYLRRIFRIVPLFYVLLILTLLRDASVGGPHSLADAFRSVFFFFNFIPGKHEGIVWASWTLGVEMVFYMLFPFIFRSANTLRKSMIFFGLTLGVSACFSLLVDNLSIFEPTRSGFLNHSFFRHLPVFALGMVIFYVYEDFIQGRKRSRKWAYALAGVAVLGYFGLWSENLHTLASGVVARGLICAVFFLGLAIAPLGIIVNRPSRFIGKISYSFYLIHPLIVYMLMPVYRYVYASDLPPSLQYGACLILALVPLTILAYLTYRFIEQPGMRLGNALIKKISSGAPSVAVALGSGTPGVWSKAVDIIAPVIVLIGLAGFVAYNSSLDLSSRIDFASKVSEDQLTKGWYPQEAGFRWMAKNAGVLLRNPSNDSGGSHFLTVEGMATLDYYPDHRVEVLLKMNDRIVGKRVLQESGSYAITCSFVGPLPKNVKLDIELNRSFVPSKISGSSDRRELGLAISAIELL